MPVATASRSVERRTKNVSKLRPERYDVMLQKVVSGLDSREIIFSLRVCVVCVCVCVCVTGPDTSIRPKTILEFGRRNPPCNAEDRSTRRIRFHRSQVQGLLRESWTKGSSGVQPVILWAGLTGCEDMKTEDCTRVRIGLYLVWRAS